MDYFDDLQYYKETIAGRLLDASLQIETKNDELTNLEKLYNKYNKYLDIEEKYHNEKNSIKKVFSSLTIFTLLSSFLMNLLPLTAFMESAGVITVLLTNAFLICDHGLKLLLSYRNFKDAKSKFSGVREIDENELCDKIDKIKADINNLKSKAKHYDKQLKFLDNCYMADEIMRDYADKSYEDEISEEEITMYLDMLDEFLNEHVHPSNIHLCDVGGYVPKIKLK